MLNDKNDNTTNRNTGSNDLIYYKRHLLPNAKLVRWNMYPSRDGSTRYIEGDNGLEAAYWRNRFSTD